VRGVKRRFLSKAGDERALGWKYGLDEKPRRAKLFYCVIAFSTLVGMLVNFIGINPITALVWTAVINGFLKRSSLKKGGGLERSRR
jgi:hypothetical protein